MTRSSFLLMVGAASSWGQNGPTPAQFNWFDWMAQADDWRAASARAVGERPSGAAVSVARLRHKPPGKAVSSFLRGLKLASSGAWQPGEREFERAIAIDPEFSEAYGNLGVSHCTMGLFEQASSEFRRAIELDPATAAHHVNLAYALVRLNRVNEAEPEALTAVSLDPANAVANYLLGFLYAQHPEKRNLAIRYLEYAAREVPEAHYVLAEIYHLRGAEPTALQELELFRREMTWSSLLLRQGTDHGQHYSLSLVSDHDHVDPKHAKR